MPYSPPKPSIRWTAAIFIPVITLIGVIGTPFYIYHYGVTTSELVLFFFYFFATGMSITVGYHRLFAHNAFKAHPIARFLLLFFGSGTFEKSVLRWASQHRQHHQHTDTELDPHSVKRGFWFCHVGWIMFYKHNVEYGNVKDLQQSKLIQHQHDHYDAWSVTSGIIVPMLIGVWIGHPLGAFVMAVCLRLTLVMNAAFLINSYAHMVGSKEFDPNSSASDHWLGAIITNGEGYHSFHHRFPNDYRNGYRWYHWDPSKWFIYLLSITGLASNLKRTSEEKIQAAIAN